MKNPENPDPEKTDVVIFAPTSFGGLAEHVHYQALELHHQGASVVVLTSPDFLQGRVTSYHKRPVFPSLPVGRGALNKVRRLLALVQRYKVLNAWLQQHPCRILLLETYMEYFSPLWAHYLSAIRRQGILIGANLHDPVRDFRIGPQWLHDWSVKLAYRDLKFGFCHQHLPKSAGVPQHIDIHTVPVGVYQQRVEPLDQQDARQGLGLPADKRILLSFGFLRNNKNIDLVIRAMISSPDVFLIVAGRQQSANDRPVSSYLELASICGVADRVRFDTDFIADESVPLYFSACDVVLITYSSSFHSQSGVLNIAAAYRKPVLGSSGASPLRDAIIEYNLGIFVDPDNEAAIETALHARFDPSACDWDGYSRYASWTRNISPLMEMIGKPLTNHYDQV